MSVLVLFTSFLSDSSQDSTVGTLQIVNIRSSLKKKNLVKNMFEIFENDEVIKHFGLNCTV